MKRITLGKGVVKAIHGAVDGLFDRAIKRFVGRDHGPKRIYIGTKPRVTLASLFEAASAEERAKADENVLESLVRIAVGYCEAQREATKAKVVKKVQSFINEVHARGDEPDFDTILQGELYQTLGPVTDSMKRIVDTEASNARNTGTLEGVIRVNASQGIEDPVVYFVVVRDNALCGECKRLHLLPNGITPRLWHLSEIGHGYHKKGDEEPKIGGLHPHCRCSLVTLMPGYGFDDSGMVTYIKHDHDEMKKQRG